ncbi:MAG: late competence development ComFB family protein [Treponema sp.]|nr:late competence development ComFB family protein [Treponema sp.]
MNVHNIMEDIVEQTVDNYYYQVKKENCSWLTCDCLNCRLDTVNYVLNRIPPRYVVSGRGVTHSSDVFEDHQLLADIDALILEGMRIVSSTKRPFHNQDRNDCTIQSVQEPVFNFPTFTGTILDGSTFEPISEASVLLKYEGNPVEMIDKTWLNPFTTKKATKGNYSFWMKSLPAEKDGITKKFNFTLEISAPNYNSLVYSFSVPVESESSSKNELDSTYSLKIKDLILFSTNVQTTMDRNLDIPNA